MKTNFEIAPGFRFGRLQVLSYAGRNIHAHKCWRVACVCGAVRTVTESALKRGSTRSCGCLRNDVSAVKHGLTRKAAPKPTSKLIKKFYALKRRFQRRGFDLVVTSATR